MRLKSLELHGFKSFPDKTVLNFNGGITVIVGPNGSGKSNISDAVRWVLGELSSKNIRGSKMEDVIFGGSDNRRPMGFAEVSLVIDNTEGIGRLDTDYDEVTVTRRYYRSGESEYMINRAPVRLRDIAELFMNTGVGRNGYSIIGQGRIAEIISQKSEERRSVFEEAAGISKYRYKKSEAERKLKDVDANSVRLSDMLAELSSRIGPLEKEAENAKKYLEYYAQKKECDVSLWLYDAKAMKEKYAESERLYTAAKMALEGADGDIAELERQLDELYSKSQTNKLEGDRNDRKITESTERRAKLEGSVKVLENDISHIDEQLKNAEVDISVKRRAAAEAEERSGALFAEGASLKERLDGINEQIKAAEEKARLSQESIDRLIESIYESENEERCAKDELSDSNMRLSALEGSFSAQSDRSEGIKKELEKLNNNIGILSERVRKSESVVADYKAAIEQGKSETDEARSKTDKLVSEIDAAKDKYNRMKLDISSKQQRADALKRMDELFEGYNFSVKNVMNASRLGEIDGICGPISRIIEVDPKYSIAFETALGANIQNIVTEDEEAAKKAIAYLKRTNGGRATFYPITSVKSQTLNISVSDLQRQRGYIGIASELARCDEKYRDIIGNMLGRTVVFDNIDNASYTAKAFGYRVRIVTLDGQLINAGGSYTGGSVKRDSGMLTRAAEISSIKDDIVKLNISYKAQGAVISELEKQLENERSEISSFSEKNALLNTLMQAELTQTEVLKTQLSSDSSRRAALENDLKALGENAEHYDNEKKRLLADISRAENNCLKAANKTSELNSKRAAEETEHTRILNAHSALMIEKTAAEKDIEALNNNIEFNTGALSSLNEQILHAEQNVYALNERRINAENSINRITSELDSLKEQLVTLESERQSFIDRSMNIEAEQNKLREKQKEKTRERETVFREFTRLESELEKLSSEQDSLADRIWQDYELTYSSASALGYPPVTKENRPQVASRQTEARNKLRSLGHVNVGAIDEFNEVKERFEFTDAQFKDLVKAREGLTNIIERLEKEMKERFVEALEKINRNFKQVFRELFGGGNAELRLSDPENVLESGIEINVAPPGKIIKSLISLSGGEQSFVAIALIFAILNVNPTPFCIFDEIEAALDEVNVDRYAEYMKRYSEKTQFIVITHRRGSMEVSDMLYGITMPDRGVSKVLSMNVDEVEKKLGAKLG